MGNLETGNGRWAIGCKGFLLIASYLWPGLYTERPRFSGNGAISCNSCRTPGRRNRQKPLALKAKSVGKGRAAAHGHRAEFDTRRPLTSTKKGYTGPIKAAISALRSPTNSHSFTDSAVDNAGEFFLTKNFHKWEYCIGNVVSYVEQIRVNIL